jgi:hypothetical protein
MLLREKFEDTKGLTRSRTSKKDIEYNGQKKKDKTSNNDLQNITPKPLLQTGGERYDQDFNET